MLTQYIRLFYGDDGTLTDYSLAGQEKNTDIPMPIVAAEDYLYIGQHLPSNNMFFEVSTANDQASVMTVEYWSNNAWVPMVDLLDATSVSGVSLARSGTVQWLVDREEPWTMVLDSSGGQSQAPDELSSIEIYNLYWLRIKFSADLNAGTTLDRITYKFTTEDRLEELDPDLSEYRTSWDASKTDWLDQILIGSEHVWHDFKSRSLISGPQQILRFEDVCLGAAYRTLAVIYGALGPEFTEKRENALANYNSAVESSRMVLDRNFSGKAERAEVITRLGVYR